MLYVSEKNSGRTVASVQQLGHETEPEKSLTKAKDFLLQWYDLLQAKIRD